jgi:hypothetical protein
MGEGVIVQRRAGGEGSSLSESYGDSRAAKGLGDAKREYEGLRGKVVWGRGVVVWRRALRVLRCCEEQGSRWSRERARERAWRREALC